MDDCNCDDHIVRDGGLGWVTCPSTYQGYDMSWSAVPGPGTILWPAYIESVSGEGMDFSGGTAEGIPEIKNRKEEK